MEKFGNRLTLIPIYEPQLETVSPLSRVRFLRAGRCNSAEYLQQNQVCSIGFDWRCEECELQDIISVLELQLEQFDEVDVNADFGGAQALSLNL